MTLCVFICVTVWTCLCVCMCVCSHVCVLIYRCESRSVSACACACVCIQLNYPSLRAVCGPVPAERPHSPVHISHRTGILSICPHVHKLQPPPPSQGAPYSVCVFPRPSAPHRAGCVGSGQSIDVDWSLDLATLAGSITPVSVAPSPTCGPLLKAPCQETGDLGAEVLSGSRNQGRAPA